MYIYVKCIQANTYVHKNSMISGANGTNLDLRNCLTWSGPFRGPFDILLCWNNNLSTNTQQAITSTSIEEILWGHVVSLDFLWPFTCNRAVYECVLLPLWRCKYHFNRLKINIYCHLSPPNRLTKPPRNTYSTYGLGKLTNIIHVTFIYMLVNSACTVVFHFTTQYALHRSGTHFIKLLWAHYWNLMKTLSSLFIILTM